MEHLTVERMANVSRVLADTLRNGEITRAKILEVTGDAWCMIYQCHTNAVRATNPAFNAMIVDSRLIAALAQNLPKGNLVQAVDTVRFLSTCMVADNGENHATTRATLLVVELQARMLDALWFLLQPQPKEVRP
jgi:hypothetical protein